MSTSTTTETTVTEKGGENGGLDGEEDYYEDDPYYADSAEMLDGTKPNLDGAYEEEEEEDCDAS